MSGPSGGGGGGSSSQTVTQTQQIPAFEQQYAQQNQDIAAGIAAQPYPVYNAPLVSGFTPTQQQGQTAAIQNAGAYQPDLGAAEGLTGQSVPGGQAFINQGVTGGQQFVNQGFQNGDPVLGQGAALLGSGFNYNPANAGVISAYMNPYVQNALQPQIEALNQQLGQEQNQINASSTQANAFGDARQGVASALANFYGNQSLAGILGQGYNTAYNNAQNAALNQEQLGIQGGQALGNMATNYMNAANQGGQIIGNLGLSGGQAYGNLGLSGAQEFGNLGQSQQQLGLQGANAIYDVGAQQQQLNQQALNTAYQQFQNQVNWPQQMLNTRLSALSNSPYNSTSTVTLPNANMTASNLGMFAGLAGLLGGSGGASAPFGGAAYNSAQAHS